MAERIHILIFLIVAIVGLAGLGMMINNKNLTGMTVTGVVLENTPCYGYIGQKACGTQDNNLYECKQRKISYGWFKSIKLPPVWNKIQDCGPNPCVNGYCKVLLTPKKSPTPIPPPASTPLPQPGITPPTTLKICDAGVKRCVGDDVQICLNNKWVWKETCILGTMCSNGICIAMPQPQRIPPSYGTPLGEVPIPYGRKRDGTPTEEPGGILAECQRGDKKCKDPYNAMICEQYNTWTIVPCQDGKTCKDGECGLEEDWITEEDAPLDIGDIEDERSDIRTGKEETMGIVTSIWGSISELWK